jgi:hypothetical protein
MYLNQVFEIVNVVHPLLKFVFFDENQPSCEYVDFYGQMSQITLKNS